MSLGTELALLRDANITRWRFELPNKDTLTEAFEAAGGRFAKMVRDPTTGRVTGVKKRSLRTYDIIMRDAAGQPGQITGYHDAADVTRFTVLNADGEIIFTASRNDIVYIKGYGPAKHSRARKK